MGPSTVLALESAAHGEGKGIRRGEEYLDALAYIDFYNDAGKSSAEALIKEEVSNKKPFPQSRVCLLVEALLEARLCLLQALL